MYSTKIFKPKYIKKIVGFGHSRQVKFSPVRPKKCALFCWTRARQFDFFDQKKYDQFCTVFFYSRKVIFNCINCKTSSRLGSIQARYVSINLILKSLVSCTIIRHRSSVSTKKIWGQFF